MFTSLLYSAREVTQSAPDTMGSRLAAPYRTTVAPSLIHVLPLQTRSWSARTCALRLARFGSVTSSWHCPMIYNKVFVGVFESCPIC